MTLTLLWYPMMDLGFRGLGVRDTMVPNNAIMENQMEKNMENEMETLGPFKGVYRDI